ncbi:hypothetical protein BCR37DRAFT_411957 [Protomyces lactucae-debilis]|uniref:Uncharacterized protein n=1 Tax=Protomyces lactucae-debilis TaxID=2754530 RepID=A0A1Y2FQ75_PROLT|nr:uncharacterized protein BCR37DRAFT_411957 [Protomyces lactucae-debilis]ORY86151.1 hypothetical protein BCR37DRAFT_411957 [Protomyces lactucae-debilis]
MTLASRRILLGLGLLALAAVFFVGRSNRQSVQDYVTAKRPFQGNNGPIKLTGDALLPQSAPVDGVSPFPIIPEVPKPNKDAVLYYFENEGEDGPLNLAFFVAHAIHDKADFYFIINGLDLSQKIPNAPNIHVIKRETECFDLGAIGEVLQADDGAIKKTYERFILTGSSVRGPFFPGWARRENKACWTNAIFSPLKGNTKLVGLAANCDTTWGPKHLQAHMLATDRMGLEAMMPALACFKNGDEAFKQGEHVLTQLVRNAGWDAVPLYSEFLSNGRKSNTEFWEGCKHSDVFWPGAYHDTDVHPFDTMFIKVWHEDGFLRRNAMSDIGMKLVADLTQLADDSKFTSQACLHSHGDSLSQCWHTCFMATEYY